MGSSFAFFTLFSLALLAITIDGRPDPGEYWQSVMKDQPMPEAIQGLIDHQGSVSPLSNKKTDCHTSTDPKEKPFVKDFEPRPNFFNYDYAKAKEEESKVKEEKSFVKDFEPRPNLFPYTYGAKVKEEDSSVKDFEPRPNLFPYTYAKVKKEDSSVKDFEPRPNLFPYNYGAKLKEEKSFVED